VQTKLTILFGIFGGISALSFSTNQSILLSIGMALVASIFGLFAYLSRDKKDKQIEEIHTVVTRKTENKSISEKPKTIDENQMKILSIFMNTNETHIGESTVMNLSPFNYHETKHLLSSLKSLNFIGARTYYDETESEYFIKEEGRALALKKNLVGQPRGRS
jgi:hypothetical protein